MRSPSYLNFYVKVKDGEKVILAVYLDHLVIIGSLNSLIREVKNQLDEPFVMMDLGLLHYCSSLEVCQARNSVFLSQTKYAKKLLENLNG